MFCISCGTKIEANNLFCTSCGVKVNNTEEINLKITKPNVDIGVESKSFFKILKNNILNPFDINKDYENLSIAKTLVYIGIIAIIAAFPVYLMLLEVDPFMPRELSAFKVSFLVAIFVMATYLLIPIAFLGIFKMFLKEKISVKKFLNISLTSITISLMFALVSMIAILLVDERIESTFVWMIIWAVANGVNLILNFFIIFNNLAKISNNPLGKTLTIYLLPFVYAIIPYYAGSSFLRIIAKSAMRSFYGI